MTIDTVLDRIAKLLALSENNGSEHEALAAMEQAHRLLAAHNLSLDTVRARLAPGQPRRALDSTQFDALGERWTLDIWNATADLFFCRYFFCEECEVDRAGRRRPVRLRHSIVGTPANQVTAKVMADHFCRTVRRLARDYAAGAGRRQAARRGFEAGCADRLRDRLWARRAETARAGEPGSRLPALRGLYDRERAENEAALAAMGITLGRGAKRPPRKPADVLAEHRGREAGDTISLALQLPAGPAAPRRRAETTQMGFGF